MPMTLRKIMNKTKFLWLCLALSLLTLTINGITPPNTEYQEYPAEPFGFWWKLDWIQASPEEQREAHGLLIMEAADRGLVERLVYESSNGNRLVGTFTATPRQGRLVEHLADDATGWWIELELDFDHQWNGWRHFAFTVDEVFYPGSDRTIRGRLTTKNGLELELTMQPPQGGLPDAEGFAQAISELEATDRLIAGIPEHIVPSIYETTAVFADPMTTGAARGWFAGLLRGVLPPPKHWNEARETGWVQSKSKIHLGLGLTEPEMLEFTSRFQSISNADPLGDHRLADAVPADGGP